MNQDTIKEAGKLIEAIRICRKADASCDGCPYDNGGECRHSGDLEIQAVDFLETFLGALAEGSQAKHDTGKPMTYWDNITAINARQEAKGRGKYGQDLEENNTLTTIQRIEHAQEEAIDLLKYLEHLKKTMNDGITANDYQRAALRTAGKRDHIGMLLNGVLGLCGESGEVADIVKKATFQGHELDKDHIAEELGDVAWYLAIAAHAIGYTLGDIFQRNVDKLEKRYPNGFNKNRSIHREGES